MQKCYFCKKEVSQKEIDDGKILLLELPGKKEFVPAHSYHKNVVEEYNEQVDKRG